MTTAVVRTAGSRPPAALRRARTLTRFHLVLSILLTGYNALWVTTLQSSEGQLTVTGVTRTEIKLMWFALAGTVLLAVVAVRLVGRLPDGGRVLAAAVAAHLLAVADGIWQTTMVYLHTTLPMILLPLLAAALLLAGARAARSDAGAARTTRSAGRRPDRATAGA